MEREKQKLCKKCHPVFRNYLIQSGFAHPKSWKCVICEAIYTDDGEPYSSDEVYEVDEGPKNPVGVDKSKIGIHRNGPPTCPKCGSKNIKRHPFNGYATCNDCGHLWY